MYNLTELNSGSETKKYFEKTLPQRIEPFAYSRTPLKESISDFRPRQAPFIEFVLNPGVFL